jgi:hypothetical protein
MTLIIYAGYHQINSYYQVNADNTATITTTPTSYQTMMAEHTLIAIFTQNPTLALSSTPFFAEVIFNQIVRDKTLTPYVYSSPEPRTPLPTPDLNLTTTAIINELFLGTPRATQAPLLYTYTPRPTLRCHPSINTWALSELSFHLQDLLLERGIRAYVHVSSTGVEGIDQKCEIPFQAVYSQIGIRVLDQDIENINKITENTVMIISLLVSEREKMEYVSENRTTIFIEFEEDPDLLYLVTDYQSIIQGYEQGLTGDDLINMLGGYNRGIIPTPVHRNNN